MRCSCFTLYCFFQEEIHFLLRLKIWYDCFGFNKHRMTKSWQLIWISTDHQKYFETLAYIVYWILLITFLKIEYMWWFLFMFSWIKVISRALIIKRCYTWFWKVLKYRDPSDLEIHLIRGFLLVWMCSYKRGSIVFM